MQLTTLNQVMANNNTSSEFTMTSLDFLNNYINPARLEAGENVHAPNKFHKKIKDELDGEGVWKKIPHPQNGQMYDVCELTHDQLMLVGMRESKHVRKAVLARLKKLEAQNKPQQPMLPQTYLEALEQLVVVERERQVLLLDNQKKDEELVIAAPKVEYYDRVAETTSLLSWNDVAKSFGIGRNTMLRHLRDMQILDMNNRPYQTYLNRNLFEIKLSNRNNLTFSTTYITGKGSEWLHKKLSKGGII